MSTYIYILNLAINLTSYIFFIYICIYYVSTFLLSIYPYIIYIPIYELSIYLFIIYLYIIYLSIIYLPIYYITLIIIMLIYRSQIFLYFISILSYSKWISRFLFHLIFFLDIINKPFGTFTNSYKGLCICGKELQKKIFI